MISLYFSLGWSRATQKASGHKPALERKNTICTQSASRWRPRRRPRHQVRFIILCFNISKSLLSLCKLEYQIKIEKCLDVLQCCQCADWDLIKPGGHCEVVFPQIYCVFFSLSLSRICDWISDSFLKVSSNIEKTAINCITEMLCILCLTLTFILDLIMKCRVIILLPRPNLFIVD